MKLTGETKLFLGIAVITVVLIGGAMLLFSRQEQKKDILISKEQLLPLGVNTTGSASASAYLVEFSDFQCPACKTYAPLVADLTQSYSDKLLFGYRHYPLPQHPFAQKAALAAEAAAKQGKFWEMAEQLFAKQESLSDATIDEIAKNLGLNPEQFATDANSQALKDKVNKDKLDGNAFGVNSTPSFYLNGKKLELFSPADLAKAVEEAVK